MRYREYADRNYRLGGFFLQRFVGGEKVMKELCKASPNVTVIIESVGGTRLAWYIDDVKEVEVVGDFRGWCVAVSGSENIEILGTARNAAGPFKATSVVESIISMFINMSAIAIIAALISAAWAHVQ